MNQKYMTISELAKLRKTTTSTLRYYDKIGLLQPDYVDPDTGYRYYSIFQYEKLGTILELRSLDMPIEQIQEYFSNRNLKKSIDILSDYQNRMKEKIQELNVRNRILRKKLKFLESLQQLGELEKIFMEDFDERNMITFGQPSGDPEKHAYAYTKLEWYLNEVAPILATDRIGVYADERLLNKNQNFIPAVPMILVERGAGSEQNKYLRSIPAGTYVCMYYSNGRLEQYHSSFEKIKQYLLENDLEVSGPILQSTKLM